MKKLQTAKEQREILANNLNSLLHSKGKTQADVIRELGVAEATVRSWFNGEKYPRIDKLQMLADYFNVPRSRITEEQTGVLQRVSSIVKIPILGTITCGEPILAEENFDGYREEIGDFLPTGELFFLKTKGDSMVPTVPVGSYVLIRKQESVEDGEIAAVRVNGDEEATLKRIKRQGNIVMLVADNKEYDPYIITEDNPATIIGKAVKISIDL
ncbi:S24 family peptidase [Enterococcus innesii]|uniref:LexA family protein n=1 Tax=Enterococcus innesii TaxID=2839759 RepID=UPI001883FA1B|nr:helix-turn-helix domain-containing protein [Enterococcus casseliflavus]